MSEIFIIPYQKIYQAEVIDLILLIQTKEFEVAISLDDQPDLLTIDSFYQIGIGNFWVALDGDKVVGTAALIDIGNGQVVLRKMFVDQDYRGKIWNVAEKLLATLIAWCKHHAVKEIYLGTIDVYVAAQRFYTKHGFQEIMKNKLPSAFPIMQSDNKFYFLNSI